MNAMQCNEIHSLDGPMGGGGGVDSSLLPTSRSGRKAGRRLLAMSPLCTTTTTCSSPSALYRSMPPASALAAAPGGHLVNALGVADEVPTHRADKANHLQYRGTIRTIDFTGCGVPLSLSLARTFCRSEASKPLQSSW